MPLVVEHWPRDARERHGSKGHAAAVGDGVRLRQARQGCLPRRGRALAEAVARVRLSRLTESLQRKERRAIMAPSGIEHDPLWYKDAIIYEVHVRAFFDSNGDGVGDFPGLMQKLPYLRDLGVTCLWLLPFYPSPLRDDGYDITNYEDINPSYGSLRDVRRFIREAHRLGIRVVTELVINHTSDQHPWFQEARRAPPGSVKRNFYVWSQDDKKYAGARIISTDTEKSNWTWDAVAQAYYWHRFFSHQPDLNFDNPSVLKAVLRVMRFWLDMGVDGMRLDAIPYLIEREGTSCENLPETIEVLKGIRKEVDRDYSDRMLLAEANQWPSDVRPYFGDGDGCHMAFHFPLMPRIFMAIQQEDRHPITDVLGQTPDIPETCQWALFLRNHDELTLEMVTDEERDYMYRAFAAEPQMRLNVGIRRRLAPLVGSNRRLIELLNSLLLSLPGTPVLYYGDEIGMGDNIYLGDRNGVRTPMQWTGDRNAGFSTANPARLYSAPIMDPIYGYQAVNVEAQRSDPSSLLEWMRGMIGLRKANRIFGRGTIEFIRPDNRRVLAFLRKLDDEVVLVVANLSRLAQPVELDLSAYRGLVPIEMSGRVEFPAIGELPYFVTLGAYAFHWFRLQRVRDTASRPASVAPATGDSVPVLTVAPSWKEFFDALDGDRLATIVARVGGRSRVVGGEPRAVESARMTDWATLREGARPLFLVVAEATYRGGGSERLCLTLAVAAGSDGEALARSRPRAIVAKLAGSDPPALLVDAVALDSACAALLAVLDEGREIPTRRGVVRTFHTPAWPALRGPAGSALRIARSDAHSDGATIAFGDRLLLEVRRVAEAGIDPDLETSRFLSERAAFRNVLPLLGGMQLHRDGADPMTLEILRQLLPNQGNCWDYTISALGRFLERASRAPVLPPQESFAVPTRWDALQAQPRVLETLGGYRSVAATLGRRTAELHRALSSAPDDPTFAPEPITREDLATWVQAMSSRATEALIVLEKSFERIEESLVDDARRLLHERSRIFERFERMKDLETSAKKIRCHGFFHLGQLSSVKNDVVIVDFRGDPETPPVERRAKQCALRDVAGMIRSFGYAAWAGLTAYTLHRSEERERLQPWVALWHRWMSATLVDAYRTAAAGAPFLPAEPHAFDVLLVALMLDEAFGDLRFERHHQPDSLRSLLRDLSTLLVPEISP
jgi:maltose alpha-D-glucosyltransferase / alpha-amylase